MGAPISNFQRGTPIPRALPSSRNTWSETLRYTLLAGICLAIAGCARLGTQVQPIELPAGAPSVEAILESLAENEAAIRGFTAKGKVVVQLPELEAGHVLGGSAITYRSPSDLHVVGRKRGVLVVRLTCSQGAFLLELPTERQYCYRPEGERFDTVSSVEVLRETFRPEQWQALSPRRVLVTAYDEETQTAELHVLSAGLRRRPLRRLRVQGAPWAVLQSELLDANGAVLAVTTKSDYYEKDGIRFPKRISSSFPGEAAQMTFTIRTIELNPELDDSVFHLGQRIERLRANGYEQVSYRPWEEK